MGTPSSIKTDNGPTYISRQFKQLLQSFSIKHFTDIPYNPQPQGIVERAYHTLKLQIKNFLKGEYIGTCLSSLSVMVFTDQDLGTGVDEKKAKKRRMWGTQISSETSVLYLQKRVFIYLQ